MLFSSLAAEVLLACAAAVGTIQGAPACTVPAKLGQPEQIGHALVQIWIHTYHATTQFPIEYRLATTYSPFNAGTAFSFPEAAYYLSTNPGVQDSIARVCAHIPGDVHTFSELAPIRMNACPMGRRASPLLGCWTLLIRAHA